MARNIEIVTGEFKFREHIVDGIAKYAAHTGEQVPDLAGRILTDGIPELERTEGGLHGLTSRKRPEKDLFGSGPTNGKEPIEWRLDQLVLSRYQAWSEANHAAWHGVMEGEFLSRFSAEVISQEGLADLLGFKRYSMTAWRLEADMAYINTHGTLSSLRSQDAMWGTGSSCLDRDPIW